MDMNGKEYPGDEKDVFYDCDEDIYYDCKEDGNTSPNEEHLKQKRKVHHNVNIAQWNQLITQ
jgi:hypothetical protein